MKVCSRCKNEKELHEFHKDKSRNDGLSKICKKCDLAKHNAYRRNPKNREKVLATARKHRRKWKQSSKGKWNQRVHKMLYESMRRAGERERDQKLKWIGVDLQTLQEYLAKTYEDRYGEKYTGQEVHIDHKIPISKARNDEELRYLCHYTNLQLLKKEDNLNKKDKILPEFLGLWKKFLEFRNSLDFASQVC